MGGHSSWCSYENYDDSLPRMIIMYQDPSCNMEHASNTRTSTDPGTFDARRETIGVALVHAIRLLMLKTLHDLSVPTYHDPPENLMVMHSLYHPRYGDWLEKLQHEAGCSCDSRPGPASAHDIRNHTGYPRAPNSGSNNSNNNSQC